jgi:hypothetical protein
LIVFYIRRIEKLYVIKNKEMIKRVMSIDRIILILVIYAFGLGQLKAQEEEDANAQANNPLANMTALSIQNYYVPKLTNAPEGSYLNTAWVRFAKPFDSGKFLLRASAPLSTVGVFNSSTGSIETTSGLGDMNAFFSYNFVSKPNATVGIGPLIAAPTASEDALGSGKWQAGLALVAFIVKSPVFQFGGLVTWQTSIAGDDDRADTNIAAVQPFYFWQLGKGTYLRGAPIWFFDIENSNYHVPLALGIGKVVKSGSTLYNFYLEPQYSVLHNGTQPQVQLFLGTNIQFTK